MPIYEYQCDSCGERHELARKADERDAPTVCPECGKSARRILSQFTHKWRMPRKAKRQPRENVEEFDAYID